MRRPTEHDRLLAQQRPAGPPVMHQQWTDLLFLHWEIAPDEITVTLPPGLYVDTFGSKAYLGLVPFFMRGIRPRGLPPVPGISSFLEMNVRTYVHDDQGRPGVWFYSLDANQSLAVAIAKRFFHLPYHRAEMAARRHQDGLIEYYCRRRGLDAERSTRITYGSGPERATPAPGTLENFLVERYWLYASAPDGTLRAGQVHHQPYPVSEARVEVLSDAACASAGFQIEPRKPDHVLFSKGVSVELFGLTPTGSNPP